MRVITIKEWTHGAPLIAALSNEFLRNKRDFGLIYNDPHWDVNVVKENQATLREMKFFAMGYLAGLAYRAA